MEQSAPPRRITIVDVAEHANVSTTTVSKVLRNAYGVSPAMQAKVRKSMSDLGYRPHAAARGLRGRTYTIGLMLPDIRNPFFPEIIDGANEVLDATDYQILLGPARNVREIEHRVTEAMIDRSMDGLILIVPAATPTELEQTARAVPVVVVARHLRSTLLDTVVTDDVAGAALVVDHLADLGHRRIAHIAHAESQRHLVTTMPNTIRAEGYRQAMRARGLGDEIDVVATTYSKEGGYLGARQLLARSRRPTAIFAGADIAAMGALEAIADAGLSVPGDISVVGYDNTDFAALGGIGLTSVEQGGRQMGSDAARLLLERIDDRAKPSRLISLSPTLVVRRSSAPPPR
ncbi:LacI family transcriptional regulator [Virgisporangium aliadipatigenens]|uniref:LacI family transcriptional regulator n=1 Tax=Virgisporangium aliadipatigenens TaxID=741659 RepID=A0A8J3YVR8_9ACTN|nr:LacI family DNA-binding transcriptional regulator [Virgisporangium aliadipatigenens]GIJ50603.1 LacI family transcriptional regulator [Virgisporangium aliadipatigenens]